MQLPPPAPFRGRSKRGHVLTFMTIAVASTFFVVVILVAVPRDVLAMQAIAAYTATMAVVCLGLAVTLLLTQRLPAGEETVLDGEPAVLFRAWPLQWRLEVVSDVALGCLGLFLFALATTASTEWLLWSVVPLVAGTWFLARAGLALTGRRRNEALWLTDREVVHDTEWGRERCLRSDVTHVRQQADWQRLLVEVDGPISRELCPRPWRRRRERLFEESDMSVDCDLVGPDVLDLVRWLQETIPSAGTADSRRR